MARRSGARAGIGTSPRRPQTARAVWDHLPEVNRQEAIGLLVKLAARLTAAVVATGERGR